MKYEIWHDEYKGDGSINEYWHAILFIPIVSRSLIIEKLKLIRDQHRIDYANDVKFAGSLQSSQRSRLIFNQLQLFIHSLIVKEAEAETRLHNQDGGKKYKKDFEHYATLQGVWGCKFVLLKIPDNHSSMDNSPMSYAELVETTFRMAFKGGLHFLFNTPIEIVGFYFDGHEHHKRPIDMDRIKKGEFKDYVSFSKDIFIDDRQRVNRDDDSKMILSIVDNAIGGLAAKFNTIEDPYKALHPLEQIITRAKSGLINTNKNGRWFRSISLAQMVVRNDGNLDFIDLFADPEYPRLF